MNQEINLDPFVQAYEKWYFLIGKNDLVIENTTDPKRLATLEFLCEKIIFILKKGHIETKREDIEREVVYVRCLKMAENSLQLAKAKFLYIERIQSGAKAKIKHPQPTLREIFKSEDDFKNCFKALSEVENPVLGPSGNFILGTRIRKQAITAWFRALRVKDKINVPGNREVIATILNDFFADLNISGKSIDSKNGAKNIEYHTEFMSLIN